MGWEVPGQESFAREDQPVNEDTTARELPVTKAQKAVPETPRRDQVPGLVEAAMPRPSRESGSLISQVEIEVRGWKGLAWVTQQLA